jgi:undecaprenyl-diphosphatase
VSESLAYQLVEGALQALTWALPLSSSGHLALARLLFGTGGRDAAVRFFVEFGILVGVLWVLRARVREILRCALGGLGTARRLLVTGGGQDLLVVWIALLPTVVLRWVLSDTVNDYAESPWAVGGGLAVTAALLLSTQWVGRGQVEFPGWGTALAIGVGQGLAAFPGVSRTAATICIALWFGVQRGRAFEISLLVALPLLLGSMVLDLPHAVSTPTLAAVLAGLVAALVSVPALRFLARAVQSEWFPWFALWVGPLAIATLAMARAWPGG